MIFRFDVCGIICIGLTYGAILYADYVVIYWLVQPVFIESLWGMVHLIIFNTLMLLIAMSHSRAMLSDPGIVPISHPEDAPYVGKDWTICGRCDAYRPPRAHHCRICKRCVLKMDHHCPWINNCVGEYNQKYFMQFLFYVGLASLYCLSLVVVAWATPCRRNCYSEELRHAKLMHTVFVSMEALLFCLFVIAVSCDQLSSIFNDETAVEQVQRRGPYRGRNYVQRLSRRALLREVCGPGSIFLWLLPCHNLVSKRDFVRLPSAAIVRSDEVDADECLNDHDDPGDRRISHGYYSRIV